MHAIRSKGPGQFRRDGALFFPDRWVIVNEATEAQQSEVMLEVVKNVRTASDAKLRGLPVANPEMFTVAGRTMTATLEAAGEDPARASETPDPPPGDTLSQMGETEGDAGVDADLPGVERFPSPQAEIEQGREPSAPAGEDELAASSVSQDASAPDAAPKKRNRTA